VATDRQLVDVLSEFARTMASDFPIQGILDHLVRRIVDILPISGAGVTLISSTTSPHDVAASDAAALRFEKLQTEIGEGPCLTAYRSGEAVAVPDLRGPHPFTAFGPRALEAGLAAVFTFPLRHNAGQLGALDLYRETPGPLSAGDMEAAQTLADVTVAYLANAQARSELQDASEQFHSSSLHDPLTGLPNRLLLLERLEHALLRSVRSRHPVAILFVDLDRFKIVNDSHGHLIGDELLIAVANRMASLIRPGDTLARLSGDEFVILCEAISAKLQIHMIARRIVEALGSPFPLDDVVVDVSASVGIAFSAPQETDPEELLREADIAMYQAKRRGGGTHQVVDVREQGLAERMVVLQRDLGLAVERGELRTEYQPIVRISDGRILGAEALLRWDHPSFGLIPPTTLIPLAEQSGAINDIGRWVLERACPDLHRWSEAGLRRNGAGPGSNGAPHAFGIAVNVSAHQLMAPDFVATVAEVLEDTRTVPHDLTLEITESVFIHDPKRAQVVLSDLKALGVLIALDDFGTGYSSLSFLKHFPVDSVKIDRIFTADLVHDIASHAIASKMVELAHLLDLSVVTEGVETAAQRDEAHRMGSECYQGFYFARPMSAESLDELMIEAAAV
jgi:diguanylate cyclase (GGDEF)-like protein